MTGTKGRRGRKGFPGASSYTDRSGVKRWRYRRGSFSRELGRDYGSPDFIARYQAAVTEAAAPDIGATRTIPGSFDALLARWYPSPGFQNLAHSTKATYRNVLERFREKHGAKRVADLQRRHVLGFRDALQATPEAANRLVSLLRIILQYGVDIEMIRENPARNIKDFSSKPGGFHTWSESEIARFIATHPQGTEAHLAMSLMLWTGAARADAVRLGWQNIRGDKIEYRRQKTRNAVDRVIVLPIRPELRKILEMVPKDHLTFLQTYQGKSRTAAGLGNAMRQWCNAAGLSHCTAHGLRKALSRRLAEADATGHQIMSVTGHSNLTEVQTYIEKANRERGAVDAFDKLARTDRKQNSGEPTRKFAKKSAKPMKGRED